MKTIFLPPVLLSPLFANAYIGPGVSLGGMVIVFGILISLVIAFAAVLYYPIKRKFFSKEQSK